MKTDNWLPGIVAQMRNIFSGTALSNSRVHLSAIMAHGPDGPAHTALQSHETGPAAWVLYDNGAGVGLHYNKAGQLLYVLSRQPNDHEPERFDRGTPQAIIGQACDYARFGPGQRSRS